MSLFSLSLPYIELLETWMPNIPLLDSTMQVAPRTTIVAAGYFQKFNHSPKGSVTLTCCRVGPIKVKLMPANVAAKKEPEHLEA